MLLNGNSNKNKTKWADAQSHLREQDGRLATHSEIKHCSRPEGSVTSEAKDEFQMAT